MEDRADESNGTDQVTLPYKGRIRRKGEQTELK
ncbi:hypothetical protein SBA1_520028 [Candidatus Sulfotelmatobacter kueseliae]|uniref:Uncharacterized protein n=1 Tax=Candidatus Sulfotelmatobacter kueseliae TaxID=2042962 RepID=A0A2U3KX10_9BACT|nr:hypothetical protein SBA1_520028 [Candidatus Sulfotelmatobacter kueseliae]